jgi:hypothetical protein
MAVKQGTDVINIMRNVTARTDASDPLFTNQIMLGYANDFLSLIMPQEVRLYENYTWWNFNIDPTTPNPMPVNLEALGYTTLEPPAYIIYTNTFAVPNYENMFHLSWFQNPANFFEKWPQLTPNTPQRPQDVLYYNNELLFRGPPDQEYGVMINAYKVEATLPEMQSALEASYFWRYVAYGASIDLFNDYGEDDKVQRIMPAFNRYKSLVVGRTNLQLQSQRAFPTF